MTPAELKTARGALGLSQLKLARALGMEGAHSGLYIRRCENGRETIPQDWAERLLALLAAKAEEIARIQAILRYGLSRIIPSKRAD